MASTTTGEFIVRVRGIPFSAGKTELLAFFAMCKVKDGKDGVHFTYVQHGRPSGEAFVVFESDEDLQLAVKRHKEYMGSRYIEVFAAQQVRARKWYSGPERRELLLVPPRSDIFTNVL